MTMPAPPAPPTVAMPSIAYFGYTGYIESNSVTRICGALNYAVNSGRQSIYLAFGSLGGGTADGSYLYNYIRALPIPVTIHAIGNIASVAVAVFLAGETRLCSRHVLFMIHPTVVPSSAEGMTWERLDSSMRAALAEEQRIDDILSERSAITPEWLQARRVREVHFSAQDALNLGVAHAIQEFTIPQGQNILQI